MLTTTSRIQKISAKLSETDLEIIRTYIQGAVDGFCNNNPNQRFSVRILFGGENGIWNDRPLDKIFTYHASNGSSDPQKQSAIDVGWLLKDVLERDVKWKYEMVKEYGNEYRRISNSTSSSENQ